MTDQSKPTGLDLLRAPFAANHISRLPKESRAQIDERKADRSKGVSCAICGSWHHRNAVHLDYVGHAALTDRLLDADPKWSWEPLAVDEFNLPRFDKSGGLWIKLTVCGVTRLGYGHADSKPNADAGAREKEVIGDALRNAAMRFGAALDLWHKGDLHGDEETGEIAPSAASKPAVAQPKAAAPAAPAVPAQDAGAGDKVATASQVKLLRAKCSAASLDEHTLCTVFGIGQLEALPAARVNEALDKIKGFAAGGQA